MYHSEFIFEPLDLQNHQRVRHHGKQEKITIFVNCSQGKPRHINYAIPFSVQFLYLFSVAPVKVADWSCQKHFPGHLQKQILGPPEGVQATYPQWASRGNS
jgi:hypothetical protein